MLRTAPRILPLLILACTTTSPGWDDPAFREDAEAAVEGYVHVVADSYKDALAAAEVMQADIAAFLAAPSADGLAAARESWLAAREVYGQTEVYRFYGGPIDAEPGNLEARINSWPLDEAYIDYVEGMPDIGIINDVAGRPTIDRDTLVGLNGAGSETDVSTGWHAIEFLLWGQDRAADGAGDRPWTDYATGGDATAANQDRRGQYLTVVTDLLIDDLKTLRDTWAEGAEYHETFAHQDPKEAITKILLGMGSLGGAELAGERMTVALETKEQEDEHSCFSDNTHRDLVTNAIGIENVYLGRWGAHTGASLSDLVAQLDPALDTKFKEQLRASVTALEAIGAPFDAAIQAPAGDPRNQAVVAAIAALRDQTETLVEVATLLDITLNLEE
jgi:putative iron-regulated protein